MANPIPLTLEERIKIEYYCKNTSLNGRKIANILGRGKNTIYSEIKINGGISKYNAEEAHENSKKRKEEGYNRLSKRNLQYIENSLIMRVESLEMQIEILHEAIKEMLNETKNR